MNVWEFVKFIWKVLAKVVIFCLLERRNLKSLFGLLFLLKMFGKTDFNIAHISINVQMHIYFHVYLFLQSNLWIDGHREDSGSEQPQEILMFLKVFVLSWLFYSATAVQKYLVHLISVFTRPDAHTFCALNHILFRAGIMLSHAFVWNGIYRLGKGFDGALPTMYNS